MMSGCLAQGLYVLISTSSSGFNRGTSGDHVRSFSIDDALQTIVDARAESLVYLFIVVAMTSHNVIFSDSSRWRTETTGEAPSNENRVFVEDASEGDRRNGDENKGEL